MSLTLRIILNAVSGVMIGIGVVFVTILLSLAFVFITEGSAEIPGMISIWATSENDAIALNFEPSFLGIGVSILAIGTLYTVLASAMGHRRARRKAQAA